MSSPRQSFVVGPAQSVTQGVPVLLEARAAAPTSVPYRPRIDETHAEIESGAESSQLKEQNWLLGSLTSDEYAAVLPHLERVPLVAGHRLGTSLRATAFVYFPQSGVVSLLRKMRDGSDVEVATVGSEGMSVLSLMPDDDTACECLVQVEGMAHRIPAEALRALAGERGALHSVLPRFAQYLFNQVAQSVVCTRRHCVEQQCARWLLTMHDRVAGDTIHLTHDRIATMLDVRRASVTEAFRALQHTGAIDVGRARVTIMDRVALEAAACECYQVLRDDFARLLGPQQRHAGPS